MKGFSLVRQGNSLWALFLACFFALVLAAVSISSTNELKNTIAGLIRHPAKVSAAAYEAWRTSVAMENALETFQQEQPPRDIETLKTTLETLHNTVSEHASYLYANYLGPKEDLVRLRDQLNKIYTRQYILVGMLENAPEGPATAGHQLTPLYQELSRIFSDHILPSTRIRLEQFTHQADATLQFNVILTMTIMLMMFLLALCIWSFTTRRMKDKRTREHMLGIIAENVGTAFIIINPHDASAEYVSPNIRTVLGMEVSSLRRHPGAFLPQCIRGAREVERLLFGAWAGCREHEMLFRDSQTGIKRWISVTAHSVNKEEAEYRILSFTDMTQARKNRQMLLDALLNARLANRMRKEFLSRMSLKLREPISIIDTLALTASQQVGNREVLQATLTDIGRMSNRLRLLVTDVLNISTLENSNTLFDAEPFRLTDILNTVSGTALMQARTRGLRFESSITVENTHLMGDAQRLQQVLDNILSNALRFTPAGGKVSLHVQELPEPQDDRALFRMEVSDTGIGMSEAFIEQIFTPFAQERPDEEEGTGLGMPMTKSILDRLGGTISVQSVQGEGTTFTVELGFRVSCDSSLPPAEIADLRALVVAEDSDECRSVADGLELMGVITEWTPTGQDALRRLQLAHTQEDDVDIVLLSSSLADMDGVQLVRKIRNKFDPGPQIILWGHACATTARDALEAGVNSFISAPLLGTSLYGAIQRVARQLVPEIAAGETLATENSTGRFEGKRFLIVESSLVHAEVLADLLRATKAEVETASDGAEAVEHFLASPHGSYDAIFMDVDMPVMDGRQATRAIRATGRPDATIPIFALTTRSEEAVLALEAGMTAHMAPPLDMELLQKTIQS